ncbi:hypothetical protein MKEN_00777600 [Mycena kentingensis (nom. inval.)]|nr:hypothetical protein MKEN_00777600 [Mycena kentingensis (nom. inval.)]
MKSVAIFMLVALLGSAAAQPTRRQNFGNGFRGGRNRNGNKGAQSSSAIASSASAAASVSASGFASASVSASAVSSAAPSASATPVNLQTQLRLDESVICASFNDDGQNPPVAGQSPSLTSENNFINFCALTLPGTPLTNGQQITTGSCNPAPIGLIPSVDHMPSAKFVFPLNNDTIKANTAFDAKLRVQNFQTGSFTNAQKTYFAAPQQLNDKGEIIGHTHIVIETLTSIKQTEATDSTKFFFFKGVNDPAVDGIATAAVTAGVPVGAYRMCSINTGMNHVPCIGPIAQHGSFDDCTYFIAE